jgi:hypothetical protein
LAWELIGKWVAAPTVAAEHVRDFALLPTAGHTDPDFLEFEICSWLVNESKSYLKPDEFRTLCRKVVQLRT